MHFAVVHVGEVCGLGKTVSAKDKKGTFVAT